MADNIPQNKDHVRKEEPTLSATPDKLDRSLRDSENKADGEIKPYPLTEEEATPNTPRSERNLGNKLPTEKTSKRPTRSLDSSNEEKDVQSDYNKLVSHPRGT